MFMKINDYKTAMFGLEPNDPDPINVRLVARDDESKIFQVEVLTDNQCFKRGQLIYVFFDDIYDIA